MGLNPNNDVKKQWVSTTKYLHIIEYRAMSSVFQTIEPHPHLHPASVSSLRTKGEGGGGGGYTLAGRWGVGGSIVLGW